MKKFFFVGVALLATAFAFLRWTGDPARDQAHIAALDAGTRDSGSNSGALPAEPLARTNDVMDESGAYPGSSALDGPPSPETAQNSREGCSKTERQKLIDMYSSAPDPLAEDSATEGTTPGTTMGLDKEFCYSTRAVLAEAWFVFDVNASQAVWYSTVRPAFGSHVQDILLPRICSGSEAFEAASGPGFELVAISSTSNARILLGKNWVSDGTIRSPLTESEYAQLVRIFLQRQRQGVGPGANMARAGFEKHLKDGKFNRMAADKETASRETEDLRRAQQGSRIECEQ